MQPTERIEFQLPKDLIDSMNEAVASGQYHAQNEIALIALQQWRLKQQILREELRRLIDEGIASGIAEPFTIEELLADIHKKRAAK